jgi:hypothetical protein
LRKLALLVSASVVLLFANIAAAQKTGDILVGANDLWSPSPLSDIVNFHQPAEKNGIYASINGDVAGFEHHLGVSVESAWRYRMADYPYNGETYRPFFTDINALFQPHVSRRIGLDLMAGVGVDSTQFKLPSVSFCSIAGGGCINYTSSNHFMEDLGVGARYYVWHRLPHIFVRPEIRYYHIQNNHEFHSSNVFRGGVSLGYTFGGRKPAAKGSTH